MNPMSLYLILAPSRTATLRDNAKKHLFSEQIGMPLATALKSAGYTDTVLLLTIGRSDIYQHKSLGKSAADFYLGDQ